MVIREQVIAAHLRYSAVAEPLRTRAHAQLLAKALYLGGEDSYLTISEMQDGIAALTGGARPSKTETQAALRYLQGAGLMKDKGESRFGLLPTEYRRLERQVNAQGDLVAHCLARHFPGEIDQETLTTWFYQVSISFFEQFADRWVASVVGRTGLGADTHASVMDIADECTVTLGIKSHIDNLAEGFVRFLRSNDPEDHQLLQSLALMAFAARLVAAEAGPDPISTAELRDATWLLDTNVLLTIALEGVAFGDPLDALGQAMSMIGSELVYLHPTLVEYRSVVDRWREETLIVLDRFGIGPLRESSDPFLRIAIARQCYTQEDFIQFFDELRKPPPSIEDRIKVELLDDPDIAQAATEGEGNENKVLAISNHWSERRSRPKSLVTARHDAALSEVVRHLRLSNNKCFVLTTDRTMAELAARWQGPSGTPTWLLLDALVQVLAADRAGMAENHVDFSALLAKLIANEVGPVASEFQIRDLLWLSEIAEQIEAFPEEVVNELAGTIHRKRIAGAPRDDPELRLALERTIQETRETLIVNHDTALQSAAKATKHAKDAREQRKRIRHALVERIKKDLISKARLKLLGRFVVALLVLVVVGLVGYAVISWAQPDFDSRVDVLTVGISILGGLAYLVVAVVKWIWPKYREARDTASDEAERQARNVEGLGSGSEAAN